MSTTADRRLLLVCALLRATATGLIGVLLGLYLARRGFAAGEISYSANHLDTRTALDLLANGAVTGEALISHLYPIEQLSEAILQTASRQGSLKCVITFS